MKGDSVIEKPRPAKPLVGDTSEGQADDHIVVNLRNLFRGVEQEELPERFQALLRELAKKEKK